MSKEVKLEDAKPGMWAEFDVKDSERFDPGHYLLELVSPPDPEGVEDLMYLNLCRMIFEVDPMKALGVMVGGNTVPILYDEREVFRDVENLHVYEEKPVSSDTPKDSVSADHIAGESGDAHDLSGIPTEPGLYRAATGSVWYYDAKSWTSITDHDGNWTYAQKQSYKRFIETSLASHRVPFTRVNLPEPEKREMPTEPGWYTDNGNDVYWFDGDVYLRLCHPHTDVYSIDFLEEYAPMTRIDDISSYLKARIGAKA